MGLDTIRLNAGRRFQQGCIAYPTGYLRNSVSAGVLDRALSNDTAGDAEYIESPNSGYLIARLADRIS